MMEAQRSRAQADEASTGKMLSFSHEANRLWTSFKPEGKIIRVHFLQLPGHSMTSRGEKKKKKKTNG